MEKDLIINTAQQYEDNMITLFELQEQEVLTEADQKRIVMLLKAGEKYEAEHL